MTELSDFLLARIAEDEAAAREADRYGAVWQDGGPGAIEEARVVVASDGALSRSGRGVAEVEPHALGHVLRHDPARVLAECEAKRRIVEWHQSWPVLVETPPQFDTAPGDVNAITYRVTQQMAWLTQEEYRQRFGSEPPTAPILRLLALPYADHPDYRSEWAP